MSVVTVAIPCPDICHHVVEGVWGRIRRVTMPRIETDPAMTISFYGRSFHVFASDGKLYAPVRQGYQSEGSISADFSRFLMSIPHHADERWVRLISDTEEALAVVNGIACEAVSEPYWSISFRSADKHDRPSQIRCDLSLKRDFPENIPPSEAPQIAFRVDGKADLDACMARLHELHPRTSLFPTANQCTVYRHKVLKADTFAMSVRAIAHGLVGAAHKALPVLPRAAVEVWMELRKMPVAGRGMAVDFARTAASFAALLRLPSGSVNREADKWRQRALVQADMLAVRLAVEPDLVQADEADFPEIDGPRP